MGGTNAPFKSEPMDDNIDDTDWTVAEKGVRVELKNFRK